jgi:serine/threonine-protein phosphatase 6 regulatory ankyrin repeat subunit B
MVASYKYKDVVRLLIDAGADVNAKSNEGFTALMMASQHGHSNIAQMLIDAGANE